MAKIYNSELTKELTIGARIQTSVDRIPNELADKVVPVMEVNPRLLKFINIVKTAECFDSTTTTIYTTPADKEFYLCAFNINVTKSDAASSQKSAINAYVNGALTILVRIETLNGVQDSGALSVSLPFPLKIDKNTAITVTNTNATSSIQSCASIYGYEVYNYNA